MQASVKIGSLGVWLLLSGSIAGLLAEPSGTTQGVAKRPRLFQSAVCPPRAKVHVFPSSERGETVEGSACVGAEFNAVEYFGQLATTVSTSSGPSLSGVFNATGFRGPAPAVPQKTVPCMSYPDIGSVVTAYKKIRDAAFLKEQQNNAAQIAIAGAKASLRDLVARSNMLFGAGDPDSVVNLVNLATQTAASHDVQSALTLKWTPTDEESFGLECLLDSVSDQIIQKPSDQLTALQTAISATRSSLSQSNAVGTAARDFASDQRFVANWANYLGSLNSDAFLLRVWVPCNVSLNQNKQIAVRLIQTDQLPLFDGNNPQVNDPNAPFVTVDCPAPFVISAGVAFSFISTSTFGIVTAKDTGAPKFDILEKDRINPMPIAMVHVRLREWLSNPVVGLYGSFGAAAHTQGAGTGGSGAEYLFGGALALYRTVFLNAGWHLGRTSQLAGGYNVGDPVPAGVNSVPVTSKYQGGFGLAITFTKP